MTSSKASASALRSVLRKPGQPSRIPPKPPGRTRSSSRLIRIDETANEHFEISPRADPAMAPKRSRKPSAKVAKAVEKRPAVSSNTRANNTHRAGVSKRLTAAKTAPKNKRKGRQPTVVPEAKDLEESEREDPAEPTDTDGDTESAPGTTDNEPSEDKAIRNEPSEDEAIRNEPSEDEPSEDEAIRNEPSENELSENEAIRNQPFENEAIRNKPSENEAIRNEPFKDYY
ncbi:hypothetical protein DL771_005868 [Monosporascus sp. 5C6A]|nr:hypothetical protein DL771_005868 [Monosporascus sp. 5C6A]